MRHSAKLTVEVLWQCVRAWRAHVATQTWCASRSWILQLFGSYILDTDRKGGVLSAAKVPLYQCGADQCQTETHTSGKYWIPSRAVGVQFKACRTFVLRFHITSRRTAASNTEGGELRFFYLWYEDDDKHCLSRNETNRHYQKAYRLIAALSIQYINMRLFKLQLSIHSYSCVNCSLVSVPQT